MKNKKSSNERKKLIRLVIAGVEQSLKSKTFVILNLIMCIGILVIVNFPVAKEIIENIKLAPGEISEKDVFNVVLIDKTDLYLDIAKKEEFKNIKYSFDVPKELKENDVILTITEDKEKILKAKITSNEFIDTVVYDEMIENLEEVKNKLIQEKYGMQKETIEILKAKVEIERETLKIDNSKYKKYEGMINIVNMGLYMILIFIASSIATTIGLEKISRTTEYMLTGISEKTYLWYNVIQCNLVFLIQTVLGGIYFIFSMLVSNIIKITLLGVEMPQIVKGAEMVLNIDELGLAIGLYVIFQAIIAGIILSLVQAIITSKVSNMTDISNSTMFTVMLILVGTVLVPNFINATAKVNIALKIVAFVPVFSLSMIPKLYLLEILPAYTFIIACLISMITLAVTVFLGSKLFKKGLLQTSKIKNANINLKEIDYEEEIQKTKIKEAITKGAVVTLMYFIVSNLMGIVMPFVNQIFKQMYGTGSTVKYLLDYITFISTLIIPYMYLSTSFEKNIKKTKSKVKKKKDNIRTFKYFTIGVLAIVILQILTVVISSTTNSEIDIIEVAGLVTNTTVEKILFFIFLAVLPGIFEELVFRKGLISITKKISPAFAIVMSSFIFGLVHANFTQTPFAIGTGLILGYIYIKTESLVPCIVLHIMNNGFAALSVILGGTGLILNFVIGVILMLALVGLISLKTLGKKELVIENKKLPKFSKYIYTNFYAMFAILIYLAMMIYVQIMFS